MINRSNVVAGGLFLAIGLLGGVMLFRLKDDRSGPSIVIDDPRDDAVIAVSVEGAIATPGVYSLPGGARLQAALDAAGGPTSDADLAQLNPAQRLKDEERIVVPFRQQGLAAGSSGPTTPQPTAQAGTTSLININVASALELESLPHIGVVLAERIVAYRTEHGPFRTIDQLAAVDGISPAMVDDLRALITV